MMRIKQLTLLASISLFFLLNALFFSLNSLYAADASPSADLKAKLKQLQEEIASKAAELKPEVSRRLQNRVYAGFIKAKSDTSLTLATTPGSKISSLNQFTEFLDQSGKRPSKTALKNLAAEDFVVTLGDIDDNEILTAKRVIKTTPPITSESQTIYGQLHSIDESMITVISHNNRLTTFKITASTITENKQGKLSSKELTPGSTIIVVGGKGENSLTARLVYLIAKQEASFISSPVSPTPAAATSSAIN